MSKRISRAEVQPGTELWIWFDTGAMGNNPLQGTVQKVSPKTFVVKWSSGIVQRLSFDRHLHLCYAGRCE